MEKLFDIEQFNQLIDGNRELAASLYELFSKDAPELITAIEKSIGLGRAKDVEQLAHRLKGSLRNFFAEEIARKAEKIEIEAGAGNLKNCSADLIDLKLCVFELIGQLKSFVEGEKTQAK